MSDLELRPIEWREHASYLYVAVIGDAAVAHVRRTKDHPVLGEWEALTTAPYARHSVATRHKTLDDAKAAVVARTHEGFAPFVVVRDDRGLIEMEIERSNDAWSQLSDTIEAHNALVTDLHRAGFTCGHDFDSHMVHVLIHEESRTWRKEQRLLCADCRESLSALIGGHNFLAPMLPDTDFPEWSLADVIVPLQGVGAP